MTTFWEKHSTEEYKSDLPPFVTEDQVLRLAAEGTPITVTAVRGPEDGKFGRKYFMDFTTPSGEVFTKSFTLGSVQSRDAMLADFAEWLAGGNEPIPVKFVCRGKAVLLEPVNAP